MAEKPPQYTTISAFEPVTHLFYRLYNEDPTQPQLVSHHGADPDDPAVGSIHINRIPPPFTVAVLRDAICAAEGISGNAVKKATLYFPGKTTPAKPKEVVEIIGSASVPISSDRSRPFLVVFHEPIPVAGSSGTPVQGAHIPAAVTNSTTTSAPVATQPRPTRAPRVDGWFTKGVEYNPVAYPKPPEPELDACDHIAVGAYSCAYSVCWLSCLCFIFGGHCEKSLKQGCGCPIPNCVATC